MAIVSFENSQLREYAVPSCRHSTRSWHVVISYGSGGRVGPPGATTSAANCVLVKNGLPIGANELVNQASGSSIGPKMRRDATSSAVQRNEVGTSWRTSVRASSRLVV